jgi:predicted DNA repair protein MutK
MASSLFLLIDDIASIMDDVALLSKVAAKKTAAVLGDDLALNAQQVSGVKADRELPVVYAVAKGSLINKAILVPSALLISSFALWAITPLLMAGGAYLCFEGFEKLAHKYLVSATDLAAERAARRASFSDSAVDIVAVEKEKIKGAIRTDFILSAEIIVITLGTVQASPFITQFTVLSGIAIVMTLGVYGLVAGIVKIDDLGLFLTQRPGTSALRRAKQRLGYAILWLAPWLMKGLSVAGTIAMFLVGGGILTHGIAPLHHLIERFTSELGDVSAAALPTLINGVVGLVAGALVLGVVSLGKRFRRSH